MPKRWQVIFSLLWSAKNHRSAWIPPAITYSQPSCSTVPWAHPLLVSFLAISGQGSEDTLDSSVLAYSAFWVEPKYFRALQLLLLCFLSI